MQNIHFLPSLCRFVAHTLQENHHLFLERRGVCLKIQESGENYLETILMLEQKNGTVRSIDIANEL